MYYLIGADGNQYGPVGEETLRQYIAEGRANAQTRVRREESSEWKPLADFSEFAAALGPTPLPQQTPLPQGPERLVREQVYAPAMGLVVTGLVYAAFAAMGILLHFAGASRFVFRRGMRPDIWVGMMTGTIGLLSNFLVLAVSALILYGAFKMQRLENHAMAVLASILALLPCTSPCCVLGLPLGIWALIVLYRPGVKEAFR